MVEVIVSRIPSWQSRALNKYRRAKKASTSDIIRFAFNYLLLNYTGRITPAILDETDFLARQRFSYTNVMKHMYIRKPTRKTTKLRRLKIIKRK